MNSASKCTLEIREFPFGAVERYVIGHVKA